MEQKRRRELAEWVRRHVLPAEHPVRAWLARSLVSQDDADDLIQEAYSRLSAVDDFERIARPDGFFFQIVRNLLLTRLKRARVVRIETVAELDELGLADPAPSPEQIAGARRNLERVAVEIANLPERCRQVFELRRIEGLSQREAATRMGVSENVIEYEVARGMKLVLRALRASGNEVADDFPRTKMAMRRE